MHPHPLRGGVVRYNYIPIDPFLESEMNNKAIVLRLHGFVPPVLPLVRHF